MWYCHENGGCIMKNEMYTYDYDIDFNANNPAAIILKNIKEGSTILELGSSTGYMTRYLKEVLRCTVTCIEIDEEAAEIAKQYSKKMIIGNIDNLNLVEILDEKYDYILMADVLEHLLQPQKALEQLKSLLKPKGIIWLSIPNVSHISIIQQLIDNEFTYNKWGLLDNTHIRFFTRKTIVRLLENLQYKIKNVYDIIKYPEETEFKGKHLEANFIKEMISEKNSDIYTYQMVFEISKSTNRDMPKLSNEASEGIVPEICKSKLYVDLGQGFNETDCCEIDGQYLNNRFYMIFKQFDHMTKVRSKNIRFDLLEGKFCYTKILGASYRDEKNIERSISLEHMTSNANIQKADRGMYFFNYDPQIYFNIEGIYLREIKIWGEFKVENDVEVSKYLYELYKEEEERYLKCVEELNKIQVELIETKQLTEIHDIDLSSLRESETALKGTVVGFNVKIKEADDRIKSLEQELGEKDSNLQKLLQESNQEHNNLKRLLQESNQENSNLKELLQSSKKENEILNEKLNYKDDKIKSLVDEVEKILARINEYNNMPIMGRLRKKV